MKTLHLVRHGDAVRAAPGVRDHDRALTAQGREAARRLGEDLRRTSAAPELVLCSTARRARETLERIALARVEHRLDHGLYEATADDLLSDVRGVADSVGVALLIAHNPAVHELAVGLAGSGPDLARLARKFPAGALATVVASVERWSDLAPDGARLQRFVVPDELE